VLFRSECRVYVGFQSWSYSCHVLKGNLVGPEDAEDSDVEMAPDDHELNYGERQFHCVGSDSMAVFNHRHAVHSVPLTVC